MAAAIEQFNSNRDDPEFVDKKRLYVRELLTNYKISLLKLVKDNPSISIDDVIDELNLK
jgi:hypothetical protein